MSAQSSPHSGTQSAIDEPSRNHGRRRSASWSAALHWVPGVVFSAAVVVVVVTHLGEGERFLYFKAHRPRWLERMPETAKVLGEVPGVLARLVRSPRLLSSCVGFNALVFVSDSATLGVLGVPLETALGATLLPRGFTFWLPMLFGAFVSRREPRLVSELR